MGTTTGTETTSRATIGTATGAGIATGVLGFTCIDGGVAACGRDCCAPGLSNALPRGIVVDECTDFAAGDALDETTDFCGAVVRGCGFNKILPAGGFEAYTGGTYAGAGGFGTTTSAFLGMCSGSMTTGALDVNTGSDASIGFASSITGSTLGMREESESDGSSGKCFSASTVSVFTIGFAAGIVATIGFPPLLFFSARTTSIQSSQ